MTTYIIIKIIHESCALLSISGFIVRGIWKLTNNIKLAQRWVKIAPHVVDFVLLASGIGLIVITNINLLQHPWLISKLIALLVYIGLGLIVLRLACSNAMRQLSFVAAILVFAYIVAVAMTRQVIPFLVV